SFLVRIDAIETLFGERNRSVMEEQRDRVVFDKLAHLNHRRARDHLDLRVVEFIRHHAERAVLVDAQKYTRSEQSLGPAILRRQRLAGFHISEFSKLLNHILALDGHLAFGQMNDARMRGDHGLPPSRSSRRENRQSEWSSA